jgi:hypothetical protein
MSLKSSPPSLSNARSSGAGRFRSKTCGPGDAGEAGHAVSGDAVTLVLALDVGVAFGAC